jgi:hypothetical protein
MVAAVVDADVLAVVPPVVSVPASVSSPAPSSGQPVAVRNKEQHNKAKQRRMTGSVGDVAS